MAETFENGGIFDRDDQAQELVEQLLATFDTLLVTDCVELRWPDPEDRTKVVGIDDPRASLTSADPLLLRAARAGKPTRTWCTNTATGLDLARKVARTLDPHLQPAGEKVKHITEPPPDEWLMNPEIVDFKDLVDGACAMLPPSPKPSTNGARPAGEGAVAQILDDYDPTAEHMAERLLLAYSDRLLVVNDEQDKKSDMYVLDASTGIWIRGDNVLRGWMVEIADRLKEKAVLHDRLDGKALSEVLRRLRRLREPEIVPAVREEAVAALRRLITQGKLPRDAVTTCKDIELNADLRYIGTRSGVADLHTGERLTPEKARAALVTISAPAEFDPDATHPEVDRLFAHLPEDAREWWWSVLGYHLRGTPSGRVYLVKGPPYGGKSTLITILKATLGPYVSIPGRTVLSERRERQESETQLTPGMEAFVPPHRLALVNEVQSFTINNRLVKDLSGDGIITWRKLREDLRTDPATATIMLFCNNGTAPRLHLEDEGMQRRFRELPYPAIPPEKRDEDFINRVRTDAKFQAAVLSRLVAVAAKAKPGRPPANVPTVDVATSERIHEDLGEMGTFARRIVRGPDSLAVSDVWEAWRQHNEELPESTEVGGVTKRRFSTALRAHVVDLTAPKQISVAGRNVRGWRGWRMLTAEEAERREHATAAKAVREGTWERFNRISKEIRANPDDRVELVAMLQGLDDALHPADEAPMLVGVFATDEAGNPGTDLLLPQLYRWVAASTLRHQRAGDELSHGVQVWPDGEAFEYGEPIPVCARGSDAGKLAYLIRRFAPNSVLAAVVQQIAGSALFLTHHEDRERWIERTTGTVAALIEYREKYPYICSVSPRIITERGDIPLSDRNLDFVESILSDVFHDPAVQYAHDDRLLLPVPKWEEPADWIKRKADGDSIIGGRWTSDNTAAGLLRQPIADGDLTVARCVGFLLTRYFDRQDDAQERSDAAMAIIDAFAPLADDPREWRKASWREWEKLNGTT